MKILKVLIINLLFLPPSVSAQFRRTLISNECRGVVSLDMGVHRVFVDGPFGTHIGLSIENIIGEQFSFGFSVKDFMNAYSGLTTEKGIVEHRIIFQPNVSFYPYFALHGFYTQLGFGGMFYFDNNENSSKRHEQALIQMFPDVKVGYQSISRSNFAWNVYAGMGAFLPDKLYEIIPMFELGMKLGLKL